MPENSPALRPVSRRGFVQTLGGAAALSSLGGSSLAAGMFAGPSPSSAAETAVSELYKSLSEKQLQKICFPFNHKLRNKINANWSITDPHIGSGFYTDKQRAIIERVVRGVASKDGYDRLETLMLDDSGGLENYSVAIFGEPGAGDFQFELTGRHLTLRADGNSVDKAAFGGPIVYGHSIEEPQDNLFYDQTKQANKVFECLDEGQRRKALVKTGRPNETAVQLKGENAVFQGLSIAEMSDDQKKVVHDTLSFLLAPFRQEDRDEVMQIVKESGGVEQMSMAFYQQGDLLSDKIWDCWRVEGPSFVWHFRGAPHVHAYINIGHKAKANA